jgi:hypothetical protein
MAVTDWKVNGSIETSMSKRLKKARFVILLDEDFVLEDRGLPIQVSPRQIEKVTEKILIHDPVKVSTARNDPSLPHKILDMYRKRGYLHVYIEP